MWTARTIASSQPTPPLIAIQTPKEHARRRKPWNRAFNTASVKGYEPLIQKRALQLVQELTVRSNSHDQLREGKQQASINLAEWLSYFT